MPRARRCHGVLPPLLHLALLAVAQALPLSRERGASEYTVVMDAGSSGTRVHVYHWPQSASCAQRITERLVTELGEGLNVRPGLSSFAEDPSGIAAYLDPLVEFAAGAVPPEAHAATNIFCLATAGLRLLPEEQQRLIMSTARERLSAGPFTVRDARDVSVISGQQEGSHEWMAVNYLLGSVVEGEDRLSAAVLGMGGASTQLALVPPDNEPLKAGQYDLALTGLPERELYIHSYLGLGLSSAQGTHFEGLAAAHPDHDTVFDPCLLSGYRTTLTVGTPPRSVSFEGRPEGSFERCALDIRRTLVNTDAPCPVTPCSFDGVYQPDLSAGGLVVRKSFFATSSFVFTSEFFDLPENASLAEMQQAAGRFCDTPWADAQEQHPGIPAEFLALYCFSGTYFTTLLHHGYGVHLTDTPMRWVDEIDGVGVDWPLGAAVQNECAEREQHTAVTVL